MALYSRTQNLTKTGKIFVQNVHFLNELASNIKFSVSLLLCIERIELLEGANHLLKSGPGTFLTQDRGNLQF